MDKENIRTSLALHKDGPLSAFLEHFAGLSQTEQTVVQLIIELTEQKQPGRPRGSRNKSKPALTAA